MSKEQIEELVNRYHEIGTMLDLYAEESKDEIANQAVDQMITYIEREIAYWEAILN